MIRHLTPMHEVGGATTQGISDVMPITTELSSVPEDMHILKIKVLFDSSNGVLEFSTCL